jgi:hypothetical protein
MMKCGLIEAWIGCCNLKQFRGGWEGKCRALKNIGLNYSRMYQDRLVQY